ncbi:hypothetical protein KYY02_29335 [Streptomyces pimonensis]|uniref:Uncharacterized protein n=1 Tax=Streptomyces pimonensis TaxID=2860288 RepID=A0ABV4J6Q9_9ACTN
MVETDESGVRAGEPEPVCARTAGSGGAGGRPAEHLGVPEGVLIADSSGRRTGTGAVPVPGPAGADHAPVLGPYPGAYVLHHRTHLAPGADARSRTGRKSAALG